MYCIHRYVLHIYIYIIIYIYTHTILLYTTCIMFWGCFSVVLHLKKSGLTPNGQSEGNIPVLDKAFFKAKTHEGCSHPLHGLYSLYSLYNHGLFTKGCLYSLYMLFFWFYMFTFYFHEISTMFSFFTCHVIPTPSLDNLWVLHDSAISEEHFSNWKPSQRKSLKLMTLEAFWKFWVRKIYDIPSGKLT